MGRLMAGRSWRSALRGVAAMAVLSGGAMANDLHMGKPPSPPEPAAWHGRALGEVLDADALARVILLRAITSAPADLDLRNMRRMLGESAGAPLDASAQAPSTFDTRDVVWHALLEMESGALFELSVRTGDDGEQACLLSEDGNRGCFEVARKQPR